jgi:fatty acid CoA ligase FadD9
MEVTRANDTAGFHSYDVMNPHDDGVSLDVIVDWLEDAGNPIHRVDDYDEWLSRFSTALRALPEAQRQLSVLPLLHAYAHPERPLRGALAPAVEFRSAVQQAKIGAEEDIPHLSREFIGKYVTDLELLDVLTR